MKVKLTKGICYMAGLVSKSKQEEKNAVGITTGIPEIEQRFIQIALEEFNVLPTKIAITYNEGARHVYFFHSRVAKQLKEIYTREVYIFKKRDELSASYLAGMFDAAGHYTAAGSLTMSPMRPMDAIMLDNLGIKTLNNKIMNSVEFIELIKGRSAMVMNVLKKR